MAHAVAFSKLIPLAPELYDESRPSETCVPLAPGSRVLDATVIRALHVGKDTNVYLLARDDGTFSALKVYRRSARGESSRAIRSRLTH